MTQLKLIMISVAIFTVWLESGVAPASIAAAETEDKQALTEAGAVPDAASTTAAIEAAIQQLSPPVDREQLNTIAFDIQELDDSKERARLQHLLDERMKTLNVPAREVSRPHRPTSAPSLNAPSSIQDLQSRVEMLNLGPTATIDDLRARDEIVANIAGLEDPLQREQLLQQLQQREQEAEQAPSHSSVPESAF